MASRRAEDLKEHHECLIKVRLQNLASVRRYPGDPDLHKVLDDASKLLDRHERDFRPMAKELELELDQFNPELRL